MQGSQVLDQAKLDSMATARQHQPMKATILIYPVVKVAERVHDVKIDLSDIIDKWLWRLAERQRFQFVPHDRRLVIEAVLSGNCQEDFRERVVTEFERSPECGCPQEEGAAGNEMKCVAIAATEDVRLA